MAIPVFLWLPKSNHHHDSDCLQNLVCKWRPNLFLSDFRLWHPKHFFKNKFHWFYLWSTLKIGFSKNTTWFLLESNCRFSFEQEKEVVGFESNEQLPDFHIENQEDLPKWENHTWFFPAILSHGGYSMFDDTGKFFIHLSSHSSPIHIPKHIIPLVQTYIPMIFQYN